MNIVWYWTLAAMLTAYAVLDGFDLGVGAVHRWITRSEHDRRVALNAIGPIWNANEVWLIAAGGMMVPTFPRLYAASFSGFYLALMLVLWLLILRGISIEFRGQIDNPLWKNLWDTFTNWTGRIFSRHLCAAPQSLFAFYGNAERRCAGVARRQLLEIES